MRYVLCAFKMQKPMLALTLCDDRLERVSSSEYLGILITTGHVEGRSHHELRTCEPAALVVPVMTFDFPPMEGCTMP